MKKLKNMIFILIIIISFGCILSSKSYAVLNCNINLSISKNTVTYGEEFYVDVSISNLNTTDGIIAIGSTLEYDKNSLTLVNIEGLNGWSNPMYNDQNGKFTSIRNQLLTSDSSVFRITFKVNQNAGNNAVIKINDFTISGGNDEQNVGGNSLTVNIGNISQSDNNNSNIQEENNNQYGNNHNQSENSNTQNKTNTNTQNSNTANKNSSLPQLGDNDSTTIITLITVFAVFAIVFGTKIVLLNRKIKKSIKISK